jgi:hypothetical protein
MFHHGQASIQHDSVLNNNNNNKKKGYSMILRKGERRGSNAA